MINVMKLCDVITNLNYTYTNCLEILEFPYKECFYSNIHNSV